MKTKRISIAEDYTRYLGARTGEGSGSEFFKLVLKPHLLKYEHVVICFDGTWGVSASWIGGLVIELKHIFQSSRELERSISIISEEDPREAEYILNTIRTCFE